MMVIDDVETLVRPMNHGDHMSAQKLILLFPGFVLPPALALFFHLLHSDGHLRRTERKNRNWMNDRLPHMRHDLNSSVGLQKSCCNLSDYVKIPPTINRPCPGRDRPKPCLPLPASHLYCRPYRLFAGLRAVLASKGHENGKHVQKIR